MAWAFLKEKEIRLISRDHGEKVRMYKPFLAYFGSDRDGYRFYARHIIQDEYATYFENKTEVRWYEIYCPSEDTRNSLKAKLVHSRKVMQAEEALWKAQKIYRDLV